VQLGRRALVPVQLGPVDRAVVIGVEAGDESQEVRGELAFCQLSVVLAR
jgi:hypothetical protein